MPKIVLPNSLARLVGRKPARYEITRRIKRTAESILENERLTADLDDEAAKVLLNWGVARAERVAGSTDGLGDREAEEVISPRLRATRRLMRRVNRWVANQADMAADEGGELLDQIIEQAAVIYGDGFIPPDDDQRAAFLTRQQELSDNPPQLIAELLDFLENPTSAIKADEGKSDDKEVHVEEQHRQETQAPEVHLPEVHDSETHDRGP